MSWRIFLDDFARIYAQIEGENKIELPLKTNSYQSWGKALLHYMDSDRVKKYWDYWLKIGEDVCTLPVDKDGGDICGSDVMSCTVQVNKMDTGLLLKRVLQIYDTQTHDILLSALLITYSDWAKQNDLLLHLQGHGREDCINEVDVSQTMGWFTSLFPIQLQLPQQYSDDQCLSLIIESVKEQLLQIPDNGLSYGVLRYMSNDSRMIKLKDNDKAKIIFNYLGDLTSKDTHILTVVPNSAGLSSSLENKESYLLNISAFVMDGILSIKFDYSKKHFRFKTIANLSQKFRENLVRIIKHCVCGNQRALQNNFLIVPFNEFGDNPPLFLVHPGAGVAEAYSFMSTLFAKKQPLYGINSYNLNSDNGYVDNIEQLARIYISNMKTIMPHGPYFIGGWSLGGVIAFEMFRQLEKSGEILGGLYLLDSSIYSEDNNLTGDDSCDFSLENKVYDVLSIEQQKRFVRTCKVEAAALSVYKPSGKINVQAILFKATQYPRGEDNQETNWANYIKNYRKIPIDADHFGIMEPKKIKYIVEIIQQDILKYKKQQVNF